MRRAALLVLVVVWAIGGTAAAAPAAVVFERGPAERPQIWTTSAAGGAARQIVAHGEDPTISPDGESVAFVRRAVPFGRRADLYLHRVGSGSRRVAQRLGSPLVWSPDGRWLAAHSATGALVVIDVRTGARRAIGPVVAYPPSFSPGSDAIAYTRHTGEAGMFRTSDVFRSPLPSGAAERVTSRDRGQEPIWGPQGILYSHVLVRQPDFHATELRSVDPVSGVTRRVIPDPRGVGTLFPLALSRDGRRLLSGAAGFESRVPVAIDLARRRSAVRGGPYDYAEGLSRDGRLILVTARRDGTLDGRIVVRPFAGPGERQVAAQGRNASWSR